MFGDVQFSLSPEVCTIARVLKLNARVCSEPLPRSSSDALCLARFTAMKTDLDGGCRPIGIAG